MKARNDASRRILEAFNRLTHFLKGEVDSLSQSERHSNRSGTARATDEAGNEFLCPMNDLKDPDFVREAEKSNCIAYDKLVSKVIE